MYFLPDSIVAGRPGFKEADPPHNNCYRRVGICVIETVTQVGNGCKLVIVIVTRRHREPAQCARVDEALRRRYPTASKGEKSKILGEFCQNTGYHRKAAIRAINHPPVKERTKRGPVRRYGPSLVPGLLALWRASDCIPVLVTRSAAGPAGPAAEHRARVCSKRLQPFIPALLASLEAHGELKLELEVREAILQASASTIDRLLHSYRRHYTKRPYSQSKSVSAIKSRVPLRTFGEWEGAPVGSLQADLVALCGGSTEGFYLNTLLGVDVQTGWLGLRAVWGKTQTRVAGAMENLRRELPFPLVHLHTDNGGEFLNGVLYPWSKQQNIKMTRGRPYRKNDQAYAEQRNYYIVRRFIGYHRYDTCAQCLVTGTGTKAAYEQLEKLLRLVAQYNNFFQPMAKIVSTERHGAKVKRKYDTAQTPYQRLVASGVLGEEKRQSLERSFRSLNPIRLLSEIKEVQRVLWELSRTEGDINTEAPSISGARSPLETPDDAISSEVGKVAVA